MNGAVSTVSRFNARINARDLVGLVALMSHDHTFVDSAGAAVVGRDACREAWQGFFAAFPDYRNVFAAMTADEADEVVTIVGRSECSVPALAGPALWTARVRDGLVARWQVYEDSPRNRAFLGIERRRTTH
jgi:ketosteroid isomerase-like protein